MCFPLPCFPPQQIFRPPLDHYDVIIHLHSRLLPRGTQSLDRGKHLTEQASLSRPSVLLPVVNFDPAQLYLEELKVRKGSTLLTHAVFDVSFPFSSKTKLNLLKLFLVCMFRATHLKASNALFTLSP